MTTDSSGDLIPIERSIEEISQIVSKQGYSTLTDAEIDRYVDYMAERKSMTQQAVDKAEYVMATADLIRQEAREALERAQASFAEACSLHPAFREVTGDV